MYSPGAHSQTLVGPDSATHPPTLLASPPALPGRTERVVSSGLVDTDRNPTTASSFTTSSLILFCSKLTSYVRLLYDCFEISSLNLPASNSDTKSFPASSVVPRGCPFSDTLQFSGEEVIASRAVGSNSLKTATVSFPAPAPV